MAFLPVTILSVVSFLSPALLNFQRPEGRGTVNSPALYPTVVSKLSGNPGYTLPLGFSTSAIFLIRISTPFGLPKAMPVNEALLGSN
ncbi:hypothetical protein D3C86_1838320 [compost metagenome]